MIRYCYNCSQRESCFVVSYNAVGTFTESVKHYEQMTNGGPILPPEYIPPPPPPPCEETIMMNGGYGHDEGKFAGE